MESKANYILVGFGVIALCLFTVAFAFWISNAKDTSGLKDYTIYFKEQSLEGLQAESAVTMRGIKVGRVTEMDISPKNIELLKVVVGIDIETPVKTDTKAVVRRNLLTGLATIDLVETTAESSLLNKAPEGEENPVIPEGRSQINEFAATLPDLIKKVDEIAYSIKGFLSKENQESFTGILESLEKMAQALSANDKNISEEIQITLQTMRDAAHTLETESKTISTSVNATSQVVSQNMIVLADNLNQAAKSLSATAESFENPKGILTGPSQGALGPGE